MSFQQGGEFSGGRVKRAGGGRTTALAGGGIGVLALALISYFVFGDPSALSGLAGGLGGSDPGAAQTTGYIDACSSDQANTDRQCRLNATIQVLDAYWATTLVAQSGVNYTKPDVISYDGSTSSACGMASNAVGPFYCPTDQTIYVDVTFFDELTQQLGASGGALGEEYVVAHEMGHHIQDQLGTLNSTASTEGASGGSVRIELQADCFAGMWAGQAAVTINPNTGTTFLDPITQDELASALSAAAAVGDDHIQQSQAGYVQPESFTHGTSAQRVKWFNIGYNQNSIKACDTIHAKNL